MFLIIPWLVLSIVAGGHASAKGRSGFGFFLLSIILSPLVGLIASFLASPDTAYLEQQQIKSGVMKRCPHCNEMIKKKAVVCKHCGFQEQAQPKTVPVQVERERLHFSTIHLTRDDWQYRTGMFEPQITKQTAKGARTFVYAAYDAMLNELPFGIAIKKQWNVNKGYGKLLVTGYWTEPHAFLPYLKSRKTRLIGYVPHSHVPKDSIKTAEGKMRHANINGIFTNIEIEMLFDMANNE